MADDKEKIGPMTITFKGGLRTDGEITRVNIQQFGSFIQLSKEQAISLAKVIKQRLGD